MREIGVVEILLLVLSVISHVGMSLFLAKPRFNRVVTALIFQGYTEKGYIRIQTKTTKRSCNDSANGIFQRQEHQ